MQTKGLMHDHESSSQIMRSVHEGARDTARDIATSDA